MADLISQQVAERLKKTNLKIVLAESCTGGKVASLLTEQPGISQHFCGSAVTYREMTKQQWLGISKELLEIFTAESQEASDAMAVGTLALTAEADFACSITGHLGPHVDQKVDGLVFLCIAEREPETPLHRDSAVSGESNQESSESVGTPRIVHSIQRRLESTGRLERQREAAIWMLGQVNDYLSRFEP